MKTSPGKLILKTIPAIIAAAAFTAPVAATGTGGGSAEGTYEGAGGPKAAKEAADVVTTGRDVESGYTAAGEKLKGTRVKGEVKDGGEGLPGAVGPGAAED